MDYLLKPKLPEGLPIRAIYLDQYVRKEEHLDFHPHYEMYFSKDPLAQIVVVNGEERRIRARNVIICSPYSVHVMMPEDPAETNFERYVVYFSEHLFDLFSRELFPQEWFTPGANTVFFPDDESAETLERILENCYEDGVGAQEQGSYFASFLLALNRKVPVERRDSLNHTHSEIPEILQFIHRNIGGDLTIRRITREFGISRAKLDRDLHRSVGRSLHRIVMDCRISAAARMLRETELPVGEISERCGFENEYYFYSFFKTHMGRTPLQYRKIGKNDCLPEKN